MSKWLTLCFILFAAPALAITVEKPLPSHADEARAQALFAQLRCVVCEGQPLSESDAPLAIDMRQTIRTMITSTQTDHAIIEHFTMRYGDAILLTPPINQQTWLLWVLPIAFLLVGGSVVWRLFRKQSA